MTHDTPHDPLGSIESRLEAMTMASPSSELWRAALHSQRPGTAGVAQPSLVGRTIPNRYLVGFVAVIALVLCVGVLLPSLGKARSSVRHVSVGALPNVTLKEARKPKSEELAIPQSPAVNTANSVIRGDMTDRSSGDHISNAMRTYSGQPARIEGLVADPNSRSAAGNDRAATPLTRHVVRKASMDLAVPDVRATAAKAAFLVNEASGEYIESSKLFGTAEHASAQLTIRVLSSRLSEVLNQLRELGTVVSETSGGQDVTEQAVDLEARLRNETSVEQELLKLLASRTSAPLTEILELREQINASRERVERLTAQREALLRLTSLATILVSIRHDAVPEEVATTGWWSSLKSNVSDAGADGLRTLSEAIAFIVWAFLAGLVWWVVLMAFALTLWRWRRSALKARATEAPPSI